MIANELLSKISGSLLCRDGGVPFLPFVWQRRQRQGAVRLSPDLRSRFTRDRVSRLTGFGRFSAGEASLCGESTGGTACGNS